MISREILTLKTVLALLIILLLAALNGNASAPLLWQTMSDGRSVALSVTGSSSAGFTPMSSSVTGITFTNLLPQWRHLTNQVLLNGSGVTAGDVDGDGWCDVYLCSLTRPNALFRNLGGWKFRDVAGEAGVACAGLTSTGAVLADLDGDGDLDLVVNTVGHGTRAFQNDGKGRFAEFAVLNHDKAGMSVAAGDLDGDGFLDLYLANYRKQALMDMPNTAFNFATVNGRRVISKVNGRPASDPEFANRYHLSARGGIEENGQADEIYRNVGGRSFEAMPFTGRRFLNEAGRPLEAPPFDWGLSVMIRDLNQDGLPDIWVCNDFDSPERVWLNQGGGEFRAAPKLAFRKSSHFSMGIDVADINRDGFDDIFVVDMLSRDHVMRMDMQGDRNPPVPVVGVFDSRPNYMVNTLFLNRGDGTYAEIAQLAGLAATEWSWTPLFLDVDLDGYEDVLVSNGHERAARSLDVSEQLRALRAERQLSAAEIFENRKLFPRQNSPNVVMRNRGDLTFEDRSREWGFDFNGVSHGMCLADFDNDGDLDVVVNNLNDQASIYCNNAAAPRLGVRLQGTGGNTRGIGARIRVSGGAVPVQSQEMICGGRYLSGDDSMRVFAAGSLTNEMTIEVTWRGGKRSVLRGAKANHLYEISESAAGQDSATNDRSTSTNSVPLFADVSYLLDHRHEDEPFNDLVRQPGLPNQLSQLGPGVSWVDLDGDGWEDLVIGGGKGGQIAAFRNDGRGGFQRRNDPILAQPLTRDVTTLLPWHGKSGDRVLLAGFANYEDKATDAPVAREYNLTRQVAEENLPGGTASTGALAMADVDGDGQLDLFVGGRAIGGRWPEAASSLMFRGAGDRLVPDEANSAVLALVGMVSSAVFSDLDGDGDADLLLACEWGPLKLFRNTGGKLTSWNPAVRFSPGDPAQPSSEARNPKPGMLNQLTGWWNGVATGDFDGDGRLDVLAANWGRNTRFEGKRTQALQLLYGDLNGDGSTEVVEAYYDAGLKRYVTERGLDFLGRSMPFLRARFPSHLAFGAMGVDEVLGQHRSAMQKLEATWLDSTLFLNRGDWLEVRPLPVEAQMAPAFAVCVGDLDGDGDEDAFLSQNCFATQPETPRYDGGRGLWLRGDAGGGFAAVRGQESGVKVYGEQRGAAVADYDRDGRLDLVVSQNGAATRLFRNATARPGLRVRLIGPPGNPDAIGASIRLQAGEHLGPSREIHAGSGYWSHDGTVQVLAAPGSVARLHIRWPGGAVTTSDVPSAAREVVVESSGKLVVAR
jgi:hypothetical protein